MVPVRHLGYLGLFAEKNPKSEIIRLDELYVS